MEHTIHTSPLSVVAVYVFLLALMPCIAIYLNTTSILLLIGENPEVSRFIYLHEKCTVWKVG